MEHETSNSGGSSTNSSSRRRELEVQRIAGRQYGVISRQQLFGLGLTLDQIKHRLGGGRLIRIHENVYAVGHSHLPRAARLQAASLVGTDVALSHSSAAEWWEIAALRAGRIHITSPRRLRHPGLLAHQRSLAADEVEVVEGVLVTTVSRTLLDLAATEGRQPFESALRKAEARHLGSPVSLPALLDRHPRARGAALARRVLEEKLYLAPTRSWLEDEFLPWLLARRVEMPVSNAIVEVGGRRFEVDCLWPEHRLIVELDSASFHDDDVAFETDRDRDGELLAAGYVVLRITLRQFLRTPDVVERRLRAALAHRAGARAA